MHGKIRQPECVCGLSEEHRWERGGCGAAEHAVRELRAKRFPCEAEGWLGSMLLEEGSVRVY